MDVRNTFLLFSLAFAFSSCNNQSKYSEATAPITSPKCANSQALTDKVVVGWENGSFSEHQVEDLEDFKINFIKPNIEKIKHVQFDQKLKLLPFDVVTQSPSDDENYKTWGQTLIELGKLHEQKFFGEGVVVGVVDTYVDKEHPQLQKQIFTNSREIPNNGIDDDNNGYLDDYQGMNFTSTNGPGPNEIHGTHVSGIIAADPQLGPVFGLAPKAKILPVQFMTENEGLLSSALQGLIYAASQGAKIINASWGGTACAPSLTDVFSELSSQGILIVSAAGNDGLDIESYPIYPASLNLATQITVGAGNSSDYMSSFSNSSFNLVHIAAPGAQIYSTLPSGDADYLSGTSMAAPFVSGAAALLWSAYPKATAVQIKQALMESVDITPNHEYRVRSRGRLNVARAHQRLGSLVIK